MSLCLYRELRCWTTRINPPSTNVKYSLNDFATGNTEGHVPRARSPHIWKGVVCESGPLIGPCGLASKFYYLLSIYGNFYTQGLI